MTEERLIRIAQEARYALERARSAYDPERGSWLSFAWVRVKGHLIEQVRRETQRRPQFAYLSEQHPSSADVVDLVAAREELRRVVETPLTDMERCALGRAVRGEPCSEPKWMDNALWRARRKVAA